MTPLRVGFQREGGGRTGADIPPAGGGRQHLPSGLRFCMIMYFRVHRRAVTLKRKGASEPMTGAAALRVGFLGAGKMATALARGWLAAGLVSAEHVLASDPLPQARQAFAAETGTRAISDNREVVAASDLLL